MVPSLTSAVYFFVFLGLCTWWSCCQAFDPLIFSCLCVLMAIFSAGHLIGLYLYQLQFFQEVVPPKDFYARWAKFLSCLVVGTRYNAFVSHVDAKALPHNALTNFTHNFMFMLGRVEAFQAEWFLNESGASPTWAIPCRELGQVRRRWFGVWSEWSSDVSVNDWAKTGDKGSRWQCWCKGSVHTALGRGKEMLGGLMSSCLNWGRTRVVPTSCAEMGLLWYFTCWAS